MPPTALSYLYCQESDIEMLLSEDGETGAADDNADGTLNAIETGYITQAINWATGFVNHFLLARYDAADLATSWPVNYWTALIAAEFLCKRRGNPVPSSVADSVEEAKEILKNIKAGTDNLADVGTRTVCWPGWSNVRVDVTYPLRKIRVERPITETESQTTGTAPVNRDIPSDYLVEPN